MENLLNEVAVIAKKVLWKQNNIMYVIEHFMKNLSAWIDNLQFREMKVRQLCDIKY